MGLETILSGISVASSLIGGIQQSKEARRQANLAQQEAEDRARAEARENIELEKRQKLAFLKSGVALEGSPLLLMEETRQRGDENINAIIGSGRTRARSFAAQGRSAFISGLTGAAKGASGFDFGDKSVPRDIQGRRVGTFRKRPT